MENYFIKIEFKKKQSMTTEEIFKVKKLADDAILKAINDFKSITGLDLHIIQSEVNTFCGQAQGYISKVILS